jgi:hypothetical protein
MPRHASTKYRVRDLSIIVSASALSAPLHQWLQRCSFFDSPVEINNNRERILLRYGKVPKLDSRRILRELVNL